MNNLQANAYVHKKTLNLEGEFMISSLRKAAQSTVVKIFLGLVVISFAALPLSGAFLGASTSAIAVVDGQEIDPQSYTRAVRAELNRLTQERQDAVSISDFRAFGADQFLLNRMIHEIAVQNEASNLEISFSDEVVKKEIATMDAFKDLSGQFNQDQFKRILRQNGLSTKEFADMLRRDLVQQEILAVISTIGKTPKSVLEAVTRFQEEERKFSYITLSIDSIPEPGTPSEQVLQRFYDDNKEVYKTPEYRRANALYITPEEIRKSIEIDNDTLQAMYNQRKGSYNVPEQRQIEQIVFKTKEEANAVVQRLLSGEPLKKIAVEKELSPDDINLGYVIKSDLLPEIAEAAFLIEQPGVVGPVQNAFGYTVLNVKAIQPAKTKDLEDVRETLLSELYAEEIARLVPDYLDTIEDARAGGASIEDIAKENSFSFKTITVDASGQSITGETLAGLPFYSIMVNDIFRADIDEEQPVQETPEQGLYLFEIEEVLPPEVRELQDIKAQVTKDWQIRERLVALEQKAEALAKKVTSHETFTAVAQEIQNGSELETTPFLKRDSEQTIFSPQVFADLFMIETGTVITGPAQKTDAFVIAHVDTVKIPDDGQIRTLSTALDEATTISIQQDLGILYTQALVARQDVRVNNDALNTTLEQVHSNAY